jgi:cytochrome c
MKINWKSAGLAAILATLAAGPVLAAGETCDVDHGQAVFKKYCALCHVSDKSAKSTLGPNLWGVVGRHVGQVKDFTRYTKAMREADVVMTREVLEEWLEKPQGLIPKNGMTFVGLPKQDDRDDVICFLATLSDNGQSAGK